MRKEDWPRRGMGRPWWEGESGTPRGGSGGKGEGLVLLGSWGWVQTRSVQLLSPSFQPALTCRQQGSLQDIPLVEE